MADNIINSVDNDTNKVNCNTDADNPVNYNTDSDIDNSSIDKSVDSNSSIVNSDDIGCNIDNKCTGSDKTDSTDSNINMVDGNGNIDKPSSKNTKVVGNGNLIPFSKDNVELAREAGKKGGAKAAETKRKQRDLKEIARAVLAAKMDDSQIEEVLSNAQSLLGGDKSVGAVLTVRMVQAAGEGNYKAYEVLRDTAGYKPKDQIEVETITDNDRALMDKIDRRLHPDKAL